MATNKNGLANFLKKVIAARDKTNYKLEVLAIESGRKFSRTSADLNGLTLNKFIDNYHAEPDDWIGIQTLTMLAYAIGTTLDAIINRP